MLNRMTTKRARAMAAVSRTSASVDETSPAPASVVIEPMTTASLAIHGFEHLQRIIDEIGYVSDEGFDIVPPDLVDDGTDDEAVPE